METINIAEYHSCGRDSQGRKFPVYVQLNDGREYYGHVKGGTGGGSSTEQFFLGVIPEISQWLQGMSFPKRDNVLIKVAEIKAIRVFKY
ncbi:MAG: hypothetical protein ACKOW8_05950 [Flavobacteriales bacterium]